MDTWVDAHDRLPLAGSWPEISSPVTSQISLFLLQSTGRLEPGRWGREEVPWALSRSPFHLEGEEGRGADQGPCPSKSRPALKQGCPWEMKEGSLKLGEKQGVQEINGFVS